MLYEKKQENGYGDMAILSYTQDSYWKLAVQVTVILIYPHGEWMTV